MAARKFSAASVLSPRAMLKGAAMTGPPAYSAWEQPQLFSEEMRAAFKSLRSGAVKSAA